MIMDHINKSNRSWWAMILALWNFKVGKGNN